MADDEVPTNMALMAFSDFEGSLLMPQVEELVSDDKLEKKPVFYIVAKIEFVRPKQQEKPVRKSVKYAEVYRLTAIIIKRKGCDNGIEFKNRVMSEFYEKKGIKKEFSVARTPQQNGGAEKRNMTLIEAARTMLVDSKLPTTFWAEAVNTACYVQNRVFVVKPYNKTPLELFRGNGPKWLFDIDVLTKSMNYVPVVAGTNSNDLVGTEESIGAGHSSKKTRSSQDYILMPLIHKDHSLDHVIGDVQSGVQTRRMIKTTNEQGFVSVVYEGKTHEDLHNGFLLVSYLRKSQKGFYIDLGWIYPTYPKEPLGYTQKEGIDYDEDFALVARIEAIRLFLAYASFKDFVVYQMDVKSSFTSMANCREEVYVCQLQPRSPMIPSKPLMKDENAEDVNVHLYRSMIVSLMYLTSSRPDIMFDVCACARFQVTPKVSHLHAMKRIFRYFKGQPKLGLWTYKDSTFDSGAYTYMTNQCQFREKKKKENRKSITGGCQFLRSRLISWKCKKQTVVANSTTEVEYMAATSCCGQVL
ncbi:putative ribonuclease H-like domain-containing protein [Tanacetum coccineum]|uniref:Ribonuclease H-like domain-containing protein n=1 Tax=Tanacetum coccineum TaxID=301880 RepID=A0ABQ4ZYY0_9ASTR